MATAGARNLEIYDSFWANCPDFSRYNPGVRHRRRIVGNIVRRLEYRSVLDVGCGDGENLVWLRTQSPSGVAFAGADLSPKTIDENVRRHPLARFFTLDIEHQALPERFELVTCMEVIEHLGDPEAAIANLGRMVAPGGHLVISCPTGKVHATERQFGHVAHPTAEHLQAMLQRSGLELEGLENWGFPLYVALKYATNVRADWAMKNFGNARYSTRAKAVCGLLYMTNFLNLRSSSFGCELFAVARSPQIERR
jgi:SAM-dependent methyltransferase